MNEANRRLHFGNLRINSLAGNHCIHNPVHIPPCRDSGVKNDAIDGEEATLDVTKERDNHLKNHACNTNAPLFKERDGCEHGDGTSERVTKSTLKGTPIPYRISFLGST